MSDPGAILVTGAAGFIGHRLVAHLRDLGASVVGWDRSTADLRDADAVARTLTRVEPAVIVHSAALPGATSSDGWRAAADEIAMVDNLALAMSPDARMIHIGTMAEYGYSGTFDELAARRPRSPYGFAKAVSVDRALSYRTTHGLDVRVARLFGVYGPGEAAHRLIPHLIRELAAGNEVPLSDGAQIRDFIHVDDVCSVLAAFAADDTSVHPIVNVGSGAGVTVRDVCLHVCDQLGADRALLRFGQQPRRAVDEDVLVADIGRLRAARLPLPRAAGDAATDVPIVDVAGYRTP